MADFRLQVFYAVAKNLSFTKAAQELFISQPAVTRHINKLEDQYQVLLFERQGNKLKITPAGQTMLRHSERILQEYQQLEYSMDLLHHDHVGQLRLGASTTIAQYVLPPYLVRFVRDFPHANISMLNGNSRFIEHELNEHNIDVGLVEGVLHSPLLSYTPFCHDELLVLASAHSSYARRLSTPSATATTSSVPHGKASHDASNDASYDVYSDAPHPIVTISLEEFTQAPLVMRERGSGTLDTIEKCLHEQGINFADLNVCIYLGSTEAIKLFVQQSDSLCILSRFAVTEELRTGSLIELQVPSLHFARELSLVQAPGPQSPLVTRFLDFVLKEVQ